MANPKFYYISDVDPWIELNPGHGGTDPGAVHNGVKESDQVIRIVNTVYNLLKPKYNKVRKTPAHLGLTGGINHVNSLYNSLDDAVMFSIHRDSASGLSYDDASNRMGMYYFGQFTMNGKFYSEDVNSKAIAQNMINIMKREGANNKSWVRPDHVSRFGRLGEVRDPKCLSYIIEASFMQGDKSDAHLDELAERIAISIYETVTGKSWYSNISTPVVTTPSQPVKSQPVSLSGWEANARNLVENKELWNNSHVNDVIKNAVTGTRDPGYLVQEIVWRSDSRDGFKKSLDDLQAKYDDLLNSSKSINKAYNDQYGATQLYIQKYTDGLNEIKKLKEQMTKLKSEPASKSFFSSKKIKVVLLNYGAQIGMALTWVFTSVGIDNPETLVANTLGLVAALVGMSYVNGKYVEKQGEIDAVKQESINM